MNSTVLCQVAVEVVALRKGLGYETVSGIPLLPLPPPLSGHYYVTIEKVISVWCFFHDSHVYYYTVLVNGTGVFSEEEEEEGDHSVDSRLSWSIF